MLDVLLGTLAESTEGKLLDRMLVQLAEWLLLTMDRLVVEDLPDVADDRDVCCVR